MITTFLGIVGTAALAIGGIPQLIKSIREGHANGLSGGTLLCWLLGFACLLPYVFIEHGEDWVLCSNYSVNFVITLIIARYRYWPKMA